MMDSLPQCDRCNSPVTDSIELETENHGKVKLGKYTSGSWICNDCLRKELGKKNILLSQRFGMISIIYIMNTWEL
jgi:hypothetical protein